MSGTHARRKADHIRINLDENVNFPRLTTGLERYRFMHQALPEVDLPAIDATVTLFGKRLAAPILISSMTGGTEEARRINFNLAEAAEAAGVAMGLGSMRAALEEPEQAFTFQVRKVAPRLLLFSNLGAVQLNKGYTADHCLRAVDMVEADALILHLNPLQEAVQGDGDWNWSGLAAKIEQVCRRGRQRRHLVVRGGIPSRRQRSTAPAGAGVRRLGYSHGRIATFGPRGRSRHGAVRQRRPAWGR